MFYLPEKKINNVVDIYIWFNQPFKLCKKLPGCGRIISSKVMMSSIIIIIIIFFSQVVQLLSKSIKCIYNSDLCLEYWSTLRKYFLPFSSCYRGWIWYFMLMLASYYFTKDLTLAINNFQFICRDILSATGYVVYVSQSTGCDQ